MNKPKEKPRCRSDRAELVLDSLMFKIFDYENTSSGDSPIKSVKIKHRRKVTIDLGEIYYNNYYRPVIINAEFCTKTNNLVYSEFKTKLSKHDKEWASVPITYEEIESIIEFVGAELSSV